MAGEQELYLDRIKPTSKPVVEMKRGCQLDLLWKRIFICSLPQKEVDAHSTRATHNEAITLYYPHFQTVAGRQEYEEVVRRTTSEMPKRSYCCS